MLARLRRAVFAADRSDISLPCMAWRALISLVLSFSTRVLCLACLGAIRVVTLVPHLVMTVITADWGQDKYARESSCLQFRMSSFF